jgi:hypothetical protein
MGGWVYEQVVVSMAGSSIVLACPEASSPNVVTWPKGDVDANCAPACRTRRTAQARRSAKVERFVASLTAESEFFGLLGTGYRDSFYKIYVRATKDAPRWWRFEVEAGPTRIDPIRYQGDLKVAGRAAAIWAPLPLLRDYKHDQAKRSMALLWTGAPGW